MLVQELLRQGLGTEVVMRKDASTRGRNPDHVLTGVPARLSGEDQAFARPSRGLVGRAQFRHHRLAGEPVLERRLELLAGSGQVALIERDACHRKISYARRM